MASTVSISDWAFLPFVFDRNIGTIYYRKCLNVEHWYVQEEDIPIISTVELHSAVRYEKYEQGPLILIVFSYN